MGKFHEPLKSLGPGARDLLGNAAETGELRRRLTQRQLSMLAIGGAIGVGLFLGSSVTIRLAGPGVIVSYLLGAVLALCVAYGLVEMAVVHPVAGSFGVYAQTYLSPWAGFTVRATYGLVQIIAIGAEVTAVAIYFAFWFPSIPQWIWVVGVSIGLAALNALQVSRFGEFEYWFAFIKVLTILVFIVVGLGLILGLGPRPAVGLLSRVVISSALSSSTTDLYRRTRMLFSLSRGRYAPEWLGRLSENGVPRHALAVSTGGMAAAILLAIYAPAKAFLMLYGVAVAGMFFVWIIILLTHLAFRRALAPERIARLPMRLRFFPYSTWLGIAALLGIAVSTFYVQGLQYSVPAFAPILLLISLAYWKVRRGKAFARGMEHQ